MKIAIPEFKGRVAPTFDFSRHLLLVEISPARRSEITSVDFSQIKGSARADYIREHDVDLLLCGNISLDLACEIEKSGIKIISRLSGEIREVLESCATDKINELDFSWLRHVEGTAVSEDDGLKGQKREKNLWRLFSGFGRSHRRKKG